MDTSLKQRLIGAVVLVALAVIFLPMLIKGPAPDSGVSDVSLKVPNEPAGQFVEIPLNVPGNTPTGGAVGLQQQPQAIPPPQSNATPDSTPSNSVPPNNAPAAKPAAMLPASVASGDYAVSFGAYASQTDADAVIARLQQAQLPGFSVADTVNGKPAWRVRIGPYMDRAQAEIVRLEAVKVRDDVNAQVIVLDAVPAGSSPTVAAQTAQVATPSPAQTTQAPKPVQPAKPEPAKPATAAAPAPASSKPASPQPAAANTGFAVQLGAFGNVADANALRDKIRAGGFSAFVDQARTDKGSLNRVRVGPVAGRADADKLKTQVKAKFGIDGMVRPHP
jgi:cell division septation protein DedD